MVVTTDGWSIEQQSPVKFRRTKGMRPLPMPVPGGSVDLLRVLLNIRAEDWPLIAAWMLASYRPQGPYPVLSLFGEAGTAKSTTARLLRSLVDPNEAPLRRQPRNEHDLVIAAHNSWVITLDNLSSVPVWLSDGLCRLATGGGFSTRMLYENSEEQLFDATRPLIINGIEDIATRGDLVDRTLLVTLERIDDADRLPEAEYWREVEQYAPLIFGALLDAVSAAMRRLPETTIERLPRMADFALWSVAGEQALGLQPGQFLDAYRTSQATANEGVVEASIIGQAIVTLLEKQTAWAGSATELLRELEQIADEAQTKSKEWPQDGRGVSNRLRRIAPNLREQGIAVDFSRSGSKGRVIHLHLEQPCNPSSQRHQVDGSADKPTGSGSDARPTAGDAGDEMSVTHGGVLSDEASRSCDSSDASDGEIRTDSNPAEKVLMRF